MNYLVRISKKNYIRYLPYLMLLGAVFLIVFREFNLFISPRFWAEEGSVYFLYSLTHSWYETLLFSYAGYYSFISNFSTMLAARVVPLDYAPFVTLLISLIVQLLPIGIIVFSKAELWKSSGRKIIGVLIILFTMLSGESWLNTVNSQFYLAMAAFLILIEHGTVISYTKKWIYRILLVLAGLSGLVSCFLTPVYILSTIVERTREKIIHSAILLLTTLIQLWVIFFVFGYHDAFQGRFEGFDALLLTPFMFLRTMILPVFGPTFTDYSVQNFIFSYFGGALLALVTALVILFILYLLSFRLSLKEKIIYLGSYLLISVLSILSLLGNSLEYLPSSFFGARYFFVSSVVFLILLFRNVVYDLDKKKKLFPNLSVFLLSLALVAGLIYYQHSLIYRSDWPEWREQVALWRSGSQEFVEIWPPGWSIELPDMK